MDQTSGAVPLFDQGRAEAFAERIGETVNAGAITLMLAIGHRTGLFDTMAAAPPGTSQQIADAAGLSERYVREWLAAMVTGGIVDFDPQGRTYHLPAEHAACLTPTGSLGNLCVAALTIPMAGAAQERVLAGFRTGAGTSYDDYPCFHQVMAEDSGQTVVAALFDTILPLVRDLPARLEAGIDVLDAGCGSGQALMALAARYPNSRFTGYDFSADAIANARGGAVPANARFEVRDMSGFDERGRYDLITTFDAVHDQKDPQALIASLHAALRPGGIYLMQDIAGSARLENNLDFPMAAYLYAISCLHCMPVSLGQGGAGLGTMWGWETAEAMLKEAGFRDPERHILPHDPMNVWFVSRKG